MTLGDIEYRPDGTGSVRLIGKGSKTRSCPLWSTTVEKLKELAGDRKQSEKLFINQRHQPLTRFGVHTLVARHVVTAVKKIASMARKRIGPHTIRHTTATHLLRAGVDINTIRAWLGHVSINTTNIYAEVDLETKNKNARVMRAFRTAAYQAASMESRPEADGVPAGVVKVMWPEPAMRHN